MHKEEHESKYAHSVPSQSGTQGTIERERGPLEDIVFVFCASNLAAIRQWGEKRHTNANANALFARADGGIGGGC